ncbi:hypothetical protein FRB90_009448 [Tulasnella sp. 427]|nr:hypothetical protein FRB90_009448 [Tulasnella sp. 427]
MSDPTYDLDHVKQLIMHAEASRYVTMAGFTILIWDHLSTFPDEVKYMWSAPRSFVKALYFSNRYLTPSFQAITIYQMSRLAVFSDMVSPNAGLVSHYWLTFLPPPQYCKWSINVGGFIEVFSLAISDLLLLYRLHALWGGRRSIVYSTYALYFIAYSCIASVGMVSAIGLYPHLHYDHWAKTCASDYKPAAMTVIWSFALFCEIVVFVLTAARALRLRQGAQLRSPVVTSLYGGQFIYYLIIIIVRAFNLVIWGLLPASLLWLGVFFIWAMVTTLVSRIMLHLRRAACDRAQPDDTAWFGDTRPVITNSRMVWARRNTNNNLTTTMDSSLHTITHTEVPAAEHQGDSDMEANWIPDHSHDSSSSSPQQERDRDAPIELKSFKDRTSKLWP